MFLLISQRSYKARLFNSDDTLRRYLIRHFEKGDKILSEGCCANISFDKSRQCYQWDQHWEIKLRDALKMTRSISPSNTALFNVQSWSELFDAFNGFASKKHSRLTNFILWNIVFTLVGTLCIFGLQPLFTHAVNADYAKGFTCIVFPILLLFIRAGVGSKQLPNRQACLNKKSYHYVLLYQIFFSLALILLMLFESTTSFAMINQPELSYPAIILFILYLAAMYLSELMYDIHKRHNGDTHKERPEN